jgi:hypothetical protein
MNTAGQHPVNRHHRYGVTAKSGSADVDLEDVFVNIMARDLV